MRFRLRTLLIVLALAPPVIAIYIAAMLAAREVARERASLEAERAAFEKERAAQRTSVIQGLPPGAVLPLSPRQVTRQLGNDVEAEKLGIETQP
jgi:hypothetical protein